MTFLGLPPAGPETRLVLGGGGAMAEALRRASRGLLPYVPRLDRNFRDLSAGDAGPSLEGARILLGPCPCPPGLPQVHLGAGLPAASEKGTAWYLGARRYGREERERARREQRLLPLAEIDLSTGLRTALAELGGRPFRLVLDLDLLDPAWAPAVQDPAGLGAEPRELWKAFEVLRDEATLESFEVRGLVVERDPSGQTARLAAEAVRDLALLVWGRAVPT